MFFERVTEYVAEQLWGGPRGLDHDWVLER